jgi:tetratricopeptide (TPR) repeat protein
VGEVLRWHEQERPQHVLARRQRAMLEAMRGRFDEARGLLADADAVAEELGQTLWLAVGGMARWEVEMLAGDASAAEAAARRSCELLEQLGDSGYRSTATGQLAESLYVLGRQGEAEQATLVAEALSGGDDLVSQTTWRQVRAKLLAFSGDSAEGEQLAREAVSLVDQTDMVNLQAQTRVDLATVLTRAGRVDAAERELGRALQLYERKGNVVSAARARAALADLGATAPAAP